jgi:hypothetical protein
MTEDEVLENIDLKGLKIDDRYYDLYWYARWYNEKFYLHPDGWFGFTPWAVKLEKEINEIGMRNDEKVEGDLLKLGFKRIPELDGLK